MNEVTELKIQRLPEVLRRVGASRSTLYRWIGDGAFPAPVKLGEHMCGWSARAVDKWIANKLGVASRKEAAQ